MKTNGVMKNRAKDQTLCLMGVRVGRAGPAGLLILPVRGHEQDTADRHPERLRAERLRFVQNQRTHRDQEQARKAQVPNGLLMVALVAPRKGEKTQRQKHHRQNPVEIGVQQIVARHKGKRQDQQRGYQAMHHTKRRKNDPKTVQKSEFVLSFRLALHGGGHRPNL